MTNKDPKDMTQDEAIQALGEAADHHIQALVARLLLNAGNERNHILSGLVESYQNQVIELGVTLDIVRSDITNALSGSYMPMPGMIISRLWPTESRVQTAVKRERERQGLDEPKSSEG